MADISEIQELAFRLGLKNISNGTVDLTNESLSNTDYIKHIFEQELVYRKLSRTKKIRKKSKLPKRTFDDFALPSGLKWHIETLYDLRWIEESQNLIILGKCGCGKTSLAVHLSERVMEQGTKLFYATLDDFLVILKNRDRVLRADNLYRYMKECDVVVLDDVFYSRLTIEETNLLYRGLNFFNEERSLIIISNRELSMWAEASDDPHLMSVIENRMTSGSQIIRL